MKRFVISLFLLLGLVLPSICLAKITTDAMCIGGISYGQSMDDVVAKYGDSIETIRINNPKGYKFVFSAGDGTTFLLRAKDGKVVDLCVYDKSNFRTPYGIAIGSSFQDVIRMYGNPDEVTDQPEYSFTRLSYYTDKNFFGPEETFYKSICGSLNFDITTDGIVKAILFEEKYEYQHDW